MKTIDFIKKPQTKTLSPGFIKSKNSPVIKNINEKANPRTPADNQIDFLFEQNLEDFFDFDKYPPSIYSGL